MSKLYPSVSSVRMPNQHCFTLCLYAQLCELSMRVRHLSLGMCACVCARVWALLANYLKIKVKQRFYAQGFSINHFGRCILSISCPSLFSLFLLCPWIDNFSMDSPQHTYTPAENSKPGTKTR